MKQKVLTFGASYQLGSYINANEMQTIAERIKEMRKGLGLTQLVLGKKIGVTSVTVSKWELGTATPKANSLIKMRDIFGVELEWLMWGKNGGVNFGFSRVGQNEEIGKIPFFNDIETLCYNDDVLSVSNADDEFNVPNSFFNGKATHSLCLKFSGDSLEPSIKSGNLLFIDLNDNKLRDGACYMVNHDGLIRFKYLEKIPEGVVLKSYNPRYGDVIVTNMDRFFILGKVFSQLSFYG